VQEEKGGNQHTHKNLEIGQSGETGGGVFAPPSSFFRYTTFVLRTFTFLSCSWTLKLSKKKKIDSEQSQD